MSLIHSLWDSSPPSNSMPPSINGTTGSDPSTRSTDLVSSSTMDLIAQTQIDQLVTAISTSGPYLWSLNSYWKTAAPLTFCTVILPLVIRPIFQFIVFTICLSRNYWRIFTFPLGCVILIALSAIPAIGEFLYYLIFAGIFEALAIYLIVRSLVRAYCHPRGATAAFRIPRSPWPLESICHVNITLRLSMSTGIAAISDTCVGSYVIA